MLCQCCIRICNQFFSGSFVDLVLGFETLLVALEFGSHMARFSAVDAERFLALLSVKASASAFESFCCDEPVETID